MAMQVVTDISYRVCPHLSAILLGKVCNWLVLNLSHEAVHVQQSQYCRSQL